MIRALCLMAILVLVGCSKEIEIEERSRRFGGTINGKAPTEYYSQFLYKGKGKISVQSDTPNWKKIQAPPEGKQL